MARVAPLGPQPVSTLQDAKRWLWLHVPATELRAFVEGGEPPLVVALVCDVFWISENRLRADLKQTWEQSMGPERTSMEALHAAGRRRFGGE